MEHAFIGICVIVFIAVGAVLCLKNKLKEKMSERQLRLVKNGPSQSNF